MTVEQAYGYAFDNAKDIIACGVELERTFIFSNFDYVQCALSLALFRGNLADRLWPLRGAFYRNIVKIARQITYNTSKATFGFTDS